MTALVPVTCAIPAQRAAKLALVRRIEASGRANEDRQDAPQSQYARAPQARPASHAQPTAAVAAHILGARDEFANVQGYGAYVKSSRLLALDSHIVDMSVG